MKLFEAALATEYHKELCPKFWDDKTLKTEVREKLLEIVDSFIEYLEVDLKPEDITLTGSAANYNWSAHSDLDLHIVVDMDEFTKECPDLAEDFFTGKKTLWNEHHEIEIYGHPVELYVQPSTEEHASSGVYSVLNDQWVTEPDYNPPEGVDAQAVRKKAKEFKDQIDELIGSSGNGAEADRLKDKIREYRQDGLDTEEQEFSVPNLVFKELRRSGYMEKLINYVRDDKSEELSL